MDKSYRIKANVGKDQTLHVNMKQNADLYEVLSLSLKQSDAYRIHTSNYGVVVGRVLANNAFGIPNAKVTIFIPLSDEDSLRNDIMSLYPYKSTSDKNENNVRYNILPSESDDDCYQVVGTFPSKRMVLDDDSILEIYDKYLKYTTVTNKAGDYMIFGVPTGTTTMHVDIDLSDIGILSQRPRDFISKGYNINQFISPTQFKTSTNLNDLAQIYSQDDSITIYPFWSDEDAGEAAITRKDIEIQYEFETTCVFMGSTITDNGNSIGYNCNIDRDAGLASQLTTGEGTIEMIRKTPYGGVEEYHIMGNQLIDGYGVWCYQIPMNLDYVGMDEYGNIVPTDDPTKGIATRTRVRFRMSLNEGGVESTSLHKAKYLVPNNPDLRDDETIPIIDTSKYTLDSYYEFGTNTNENCYRDLYWNKIYSVKSYIPRVQFKNSRANYAYFSGLKGVNKRDALKNNLIPYNSIGLNPKMTFVQLLKGIIKENDEIEFRWYDYNVTGEEYNENETANEIIREMDAISLDFYNDWLNGCLYFPQWHWRRRKKTKYKKGEIVYTSQFCDCGGSEKKKMYLMPTCSFMYSGDSLDFSEEEASTDRDDYHRMNYGYVYFDRGLIKNIFNKDSANIYYYSVGNQVDYSKRNENFKYARLFSTDIILLGSLVDDDMDGVPKFNAYLPSTTCIIPNVGSIYSDSDDESEDGTSSVIGITGSAGHNTSEDSEDEVETEQEEYFINGMKWNYLWNYKSGEISTKSDDKIFNNKYGDGLFFGITSNVLFSLLFPIFYTKAKSCINLERICELSVANDASINLTNQTIITDSSGQKYSDVTVDADGLITRKEVENMDDRALFATLNYNKLIGTEIDNLTKYKKYNLSYLYPVDFDGRMSSFIDDYTNGRVKDYPNEDYISFRLGARKNDDKVRHFYRSKVNNGTVTYVGNAFPLYENSFYFYFGLHNGETAIDKLYKSYFAECPDNYTSPYSIDVIKTSPSACNQNGTISIEADGIATPYEVTLSDASDYVISSVKNVKSKTVELSNTLESGTYKITVIDANGIMMEEEVVLTGPSISMNYSVDGIDGTYYGNSTDEDFCTIGNSTNGNITIISFIINGETYVLKNADDVSDIILPVGSDGQYYVYLEQENGDENSEEFYQTILMKIEHPSVKDVFSECLCGGGDYMNKPYFISNDNMLVFNIYVPGDYKFTITQMCYNDESGEQYMSENNDVYTINVSDITEFYTTINDVPSQYIFGNSTSGYNRKFYPYSDDAEALNGWIALNDENTYSFPSVENNGSLWVASEGDNSALTILKAKLNSMFKISNASYISSSDSSNEFTYYTSTDEEYFNRLTTPVYNSSIKSENGIDSYIIRSENSVSCVPSQANLVSSNYRLTDSDGISSISPSFEKYGFNPLFSDDRRNGNYIASFKVLYGDYANNIGSPENANDLQNYVEYDGYLSSSASSFMYAFDALYGDDTYTRHYRTMFVDRRLDYDLVLFTPYDMEGDNEEWSNVRISGFTYNGIDMVYSGDFKLIIKEYDSESDAKDTEYTYIGYNEDNSLSATTFLNKEGKPRYYESTICGYDITDGYWANGHEPTVEGVNILNRETYSSSTAYNGCFDEDNYPTIRLIDLSNIPSDGETTDFSVTSCSYDIQVNGTSELTAYAEQGDETTFSITHDRLITPVNNIAINTPNIIYEYSSSSNKMMPKTFNAEFGIASHEVDGFRIKTKLPKFISDDSSHRLMMGLRGLASIPSSAVMNDVSSNLQSFDDDGYFTVFNDSDSFVQNSFNVSETDISGMELAGIYFEEKYLNSSGDGLMKSIQVKNLSNLFNVSSFELSVNPSAGIRYDDGLLYMSFNIKNEYLSSMFSGTNNAKIFGAYNGVSFIGNCTSVSKGNEIMSLSFDCSSAPSNLTNIKVCLNMKVNGMIYSIRFSVTVGEETIGEYE